jgi:hypothetical protein
MRVSGIFTAATVSPSPSLRQRPSCYTIRAGRNLPDKEFRYLRQICYYHPLLEQHEIATLPSVARNDAFPFVIARSPDIHRDDEAISADSGPLISDRLSMSPWSSDYIIGGCLCKQPGHSTQWLSCVTSTTLRHIVSEDPPNAMGFPADRPHPMICYSGSQNNF